MFKCPGPCVVGRQTILSPRTLKRTGVNLPSLTVGQTQFDPLEWQAKCWPHCSTLSVRSE